jgi:hypothetical protein
MKMKLHPNQKVECYNRSQLSSLFAWGEDEETKSKKKTHAEHGAVKALRQEDHKFKANLGYIVNLQKQNKTKKQQQTHSKYVILKVCNNLRNFLKGSFKHHFLGQGGQARE